ncbi:hypothetical protein CAPI_00860 [Corynebacterium capitovis DSM 44611]|nr:hypothetical protein CAPI_00860 [Corynebacterium capitovis DSM 44611]
MNPIEYIQLQINNALGPLIHLGSSGLSKLSLALHLF